MEAGWTRMGVEQVLIRVESLALQFIREVGVVQHETFLVDVDLLNIPSVLVSGSRGRVCSGFC